ncbi:MAG: TetR/AcrR family transcriptional regulator [Actinomycetota bacterium]
MSNTATPPTRARRATAKAADTQARLIASGIELFSIRGFDATSTRQIEAAAGVQRNLINYHFGSKDEFWKRCVSVLFARTEAAVDIAIGHARDIEPAERIRFLIRQYLRASAANPEIMRIMFDEGRCDDWRLAWLVENHVRGFYDAVRQIFEHGREHGVVPEISVTQFYYLLVSSASIFAMAPECRLLTDTDPMTPAMIDAQADAVAALLTASTNAEPNASAPDHGGRS